MATVGGISIDVSANTASVQGSLDKAARAFSSFGGKANTAMNIANKAAFGLGTAIGTTARITGSLVGAMVPAVGIVGGGFVAAIGAGIKASADWADSLTELSDRVNVSTATIQELEYAGIKFGVGTEAITKGLETVNTRLGQFIQDGGGPAAEAFDALGISTKIASGELRTTEDVALASLDAIAGLGTQAEKAARAAALFGKASGPELAALTSQGSAGLAKAREEAKALGFVLDDTRLNSVAAVSDAFEGLTTLIGRQFTSAIAGSSGQIVDFTRTVALQIPVLLGYIQTVLEALNLIQQTPLRAATVAREAAEKNLAGLLREKAGASGGKSRKPSPFDYMSPNGFPVEGYSGPSDTDVAVATAEVYRTATAEQRYKRQAEAPIFSPRADRIVLGGGARSGGGSRGGSGGAVSQADNFANELKGVLDNLSTSTERGIKKFADDTVILDEAFKRGALSADGYAIATKRANDALKGLSSDDLIKATKPLGDISLAPITKNFTTGIEALNDFVQEAANAYDEFEAIGASLGDRFVDGLLDGDLSSVAKSFFKDLTRAFLDELIGDPLSDIGRNIGASLSQSIRGGSSGGSGGGGDFFSSAFKVIGSLFGGGKAGGGPVSGGKAYLVGERGPEIFSPGSNGNITPNHVLMGASPRGGNQQVTITVNAQGAILANQMRQEIAMAVAGAIPVNSSVARNDQRRDNGRRLR